MIKSFKIAAKSLTIPIRNRYLKKRYACSLKAQKISGPALVFCSLNSKIDPLVLTTFLKPNVHLVIDKNNKLLSKVQSMFGFVCAQVVSPDIVSMRRIKKLIDKGEIVVFFPLDQPLVKKKISPVYAKIIKHFKVSVFIACISGSEFVLPFWQRTKNFTRISATITDSFDKYFGQKATIKSIENRLLSGLKNEQQQQEKCIGKAPAEQIEKIIFACPECGALCTIKSKKDRFWCSACGDYNSFLQNGTILGSHFKNVGDWLFWQNDFAREIIERRRENDEVILHDIGFKVKNLEEKQHNLFKGFFETFLFPDRLLIANKKMRKEIKLTDILEIKINSKNCLFIFAKQDTKLKLIPTSAISVSKYVIFIQQLKKHS